MSRWSRDHKARIISDMHAWSRAEVVATRHWRYGLERSCERAHGRSRQLVHDAASTTATCLIWSRRRWQRGLARVRVGLHRCGRALAERGVADAVVLFMRFLVRWTMLLLIGMVGGFCAQAMVDVTVHILAPNSTRVEVSSNR